MGLFKKALYILQNEGLGAFFEAFTSWCKIRLLVPIRVGWYCLTNPRDVFTKHRSTWITYEPTSLVGQPAVTIIIPFRDGLSVLQTCVESILQKTTYQNFVILLVDNQSSKLETHEYLKAVAQDARVRVVSYDAPFNYSALHNFAVSQITTEYFVLLNNDTEIITPDWMQALLRVGQASDVGAVGALLLYPNGTVQHAGVWINTFVNGAFHIYLGAQVAGRHQRRIESICEYSAVTAACLLTKKSIYESVGGLDAENLAISFNDVDYCLKLRASGYRVIYTPEARLYHYESYSRGYDFLDNKKKKRSMEEATFLKKKWPEYQKRDPFFSLLDWFTQ